MAYKNLNINGRWTTEHKLVMEKQLGRKLEPSEVVHHINGKTKDNRIENLKLMSLREHSRMHHIVAEYIKLSCHNCKKEFTVKKKLYTWRKKKGQVNFYCSKKCSTPPNLLKHNILEQVRKGLNEGLTGYAISKKYNLSYSAVYYNISAKINKTHL